MRRPRPVMQTPSARADTEKPNLTDCCAARRGRRLAVGDVPRILSIVLAFAVGAAFSWWVMRPPAPAASRSAAVARDHGAGPTAAERAVVGAVVDGAVGIPPAAATAPRPVPGAGQRRALRRAIEGLERNPPAVAGNEIIDEEARAAVGVGLRAALAGEGEQP